MIIAPCRRLSALYCLVASISVASYKNRRPLVDWNYADPLDMFDATTHVKGAAVLEMLRYLVDGADAMWKPASQDEPFFQALQRYLVTHRRHSVDTPDLIAAIRSATGQELGWFFSRVGVPGRVSGIPSGGKI